MTKKWTGMYGAHESLLKATVSVLKKHPTMKNQKVILAMVYGGAAAQGSPWETVPLPSLSCDSPSLTALGPWMAGINAAESALADGIVAGNLKTVADAAGGLNCALNDVVDPAKVAINAQTDYKDYSSTIGDISQVLGDLSSKADALVDDPPVDGPVGGPTLKDYAQSVAEGVLKFINPINAAVLSDLKCSDITSSSGYGVVIKDLDAALETFKSKFLLTFEMPTTPVCPSSSMPSSGSSSMSASMSASVSSSVSPAPPSVSVSGSATSGASTAPSSAPSSVSVSGAATSGASVSASASGHATSIHSSDPGKHCTPCVSGATDCVPCSTPVCEGCKPICTASPCIPVCPTCEVITTAVATLTTYCPEPTTICTNNVCHTVTEASTLTITDCPCTIVTAINPSPNAEVTVKTVIGGETRTINALGGAISPEVTGTLEATGVAVANGASSTAASLMVLFAALLTYF